MLLPLRAAEVALQVAVARAHVLHRVDAVEVLRSGEHGDPLIVVRPTAVDVRGVEVVDHRVARHDVDPADGVDQLDEAQETDPDVVVDVDPEILLHGGDGRTRPAV